MASRTTTDPIEILLEMGVDLDNLSDEEDYLSALKEAIATIQFQTKGGGDERSAILSQEVIRVRKQRKAADSKFKARKTKISAGSLKKGSATGTNVAPKALPGSAIVSYQKPEVEEKKEEKKKGSSKNLILEISETVTRIADILKDQYKLKRDTATFDRKKTEREKRDLQKKNLAKRFEGLKKVAQKIIAPVKGIFDRIMGFLFNIILGKFLIKLVEWFSNPDNQSKIKSIIRFLTDNWPKLLSAYIVFGTGLGKFSRFLVKILARGAVRLAAATTGLLARLFGSRALGKFSRFFGKRGRLIAGGIEAVTTIVAFKALEDAFTKGVAPEKSASIDNDIPISGYQGGGLVQPIFKFGGGGSVKFNLLDPRTWMSGKGQQAVDSKKTGAYGNNSLSGRLLNRRNATNEAIQKMRGYEEGGEVDGPGGIDKVPAMLTDGEFVMSRGAVHKYGLSQLESMNAAGGGTNKPKIMNGMVYAVGGGGIGAYFNEVKERFILGDDSLLNRLAHGDRKGALEALGIKVDENTKAAKENTKQRREESKQRSEDIYTVEELIAGAVGIAQSLEQQAAGLYDQAMSGAAQLIDQSVVIAEQSAQQAKQLVEGIPAAAKKQYDQSIRGIYSATADPLKAAEAKRYVTQAEFDKLSPEEQLDKLIIDQTNKDGVVTSTTTALTKRNQDRQTATIERLTKGLDSENFLERLKADIMNRGIISLPSQMLSDMGATEGFDNLISGLSGGKIKQTSAVLSGLEMTAKGMLGDAGKPFRTDASSILKYNKPLMEFAIKNNLVNSKGEYMVGKGSWSDALGIEAYATQDIGLSKEEKEKNFRIVGGTKDRQGKYTVIDDKGKPQTRYTEHLYDKMQRESMGSGGAAKIANYGLGQFNFSVDQKTGKAIVTDSWDSNNSAAYYFDESEAAFKKGDPYIGAFKGLSGVLRMNQNSLLGLGDTGFANNLPAGVRIESEDDFRHLLNSTPSAIKRESAQISQSSANKAGYFSPVTGKFYVSYAEALKDPRVKASEDIKKKFNFSPNQQSNLTIPGMPTNASGSNVTVVKAPAKSTNPKLNGSGSEVPSRPPGNGDPAKFRIFGIPIPFL